MLYVITGLKARVLKLVLAAPFVLVGWVMVTDGLGSPGEKVVVLVVGGIMTLAGVVLSIGAFANDELVVERPSDSSGWR